MLLTQPDFTIPMRADTCSRIIMLTGIVFALAATRLQTFADDGHWITSWACGPQLTEPGNLPPVPLANSTLREFVHATVGGKILRVRFSNAYGTDSVNIKSVHIALSAGAGSAGNGDINPATDKALTFRGAPGLVIPPGETAYSDPVAFDLPAITNVAVSIYYGNISATTINGHPGSRTTSFIVASNAVSAASLPAATKTVHWYTATGIEVLANSSARTIAVLGDSITDGRGSTDNGNNRWPDVLAARLIANAPTTNVSVANMGIGGGGIFGGLGPSAINRFDRDIIGQSGVRYLILFEGVNDIGGGIQQHDDGDQPGKYLHAVCQQGARAEHPRVWRDHHAVWREWILQRPA